MLYIKIYLKKVEKSIRVFLDEVLIKQATRFYTRTIKLVLGRFIQVQIGKSLVISVGR